MTESAFTIIPARSRDDLRTVAGLFQAYAASLGFDLAYQNFEAELSGLPGKYAPPGGELLLARDADGKALGCVALRPLEPAGCCEMKRLYVSPEARGLGLGKALVSAIIDKARSLGYAEMRLDTIPSMAQAIALYEKAGFEPMAPYYETPIEGTLFMRLRLEQK